MSGTTRVLIGACLVAGGLSLTIAVLVSRPAYDWLIGDRLRSTLKKSRHRFFLWSRGGRDALENPDEEIESVYRENRFTSAAVGLVVVLVGALMILHS